MEEGSGKLASGGPDHIVTKTDLDSIKSLPSKQKFDEGLFK